jgi:uncharacterized repeat protein (TIGR03806 family)
VKALALALALAAAPCAAEVNRDAILQPRPPKVLSAFGFFDAALAPAAGVQPYDIASPLFSDYADKDRFVFTPGPAPWSVTGVLAFPVGAALIKTFRYGEHRVETRVLLHQEAGWKAYSYVWNADQTEADLKIAGADLTVDTAHGTIAYHVPNVNQCKACHIDADKVFSPIGPKVRNLNTGDQLARLAAAGVLAEVQDGAPATPDYRDAALPLESRARAYLDANCGHCHAPGRPADTSGLFLTWDETDPTRLGVMKHPVAAGRGSGDLEFDIVPGDPAASILTYRVASTDPGVMMPEVGRGLVHDEGLALLSDWIAAMQ